MANEINVIEIFKSIQGEGWNFGKEVVFFRIAGCNLNCPWCDTDWSIKNVKHTFSSPARIIDHINVYFPGVKSIIFTGGEPTKDIKQFEAIVKEFLKNDFYVMIETNGLNDIKQRKNLWVSASPKIIYHKFYQRKGIIKNADEVRVVIDPNFTTDKQIEVIRFFKKNIKCDKWFLSPCEINGKFNFIQLAEIYNILKHEDFNISVQIHKLMNVR